MAKGFFITGTDTGVGKTVISAAIIKAVRFLGGNVCPMKPIESGCIREGEMLVPSDGIFLKQAAQVDEPITVITPCRLESPLAPLAASEIDMKEVDLTLIRNAFEKLSGRYEVLVVEGIGGLMVPIRKGYFTLDLAMEFGLPLIVVARPGLGTINHIMLTVSCALKAGLDIAGIVINYAGLPENSLAEQTNPGLLERVSPVPVIGTFPYLKNIDGDGITRAALDNLDLKTLKKYL